MRISDLLRSVGLLLLIGGSTAVLGQYENNWIEAGRDGSDRSPRNAIAGGYEAGGGETFVCRARYRGKTYAGKTIGGSCFFAVDRNERSSNEFDVLTGSARRFRWVREDADDYAVKADDDRRVCRVADGAGLYPGTLIDGRCRYSRSGRGFNSRNFELLVGDRISADIIEASNNGSLDALRAAIRAGQMIDRRDDAGRTALMIAAEKGYSTLVDELIYQRASVNASDDNGNTALILASREDKEGIVRRLLREGADAGIENDEGNTALSIAAERGHVDVLRELIRDESFAGIGSYDSENAFRKAAANGHEDSVEVFIENGVNVNAADERTGKTALMEAAAGKHGDVIKLLLRNTADLFVMDSQRLTAFEYAVLADSDKTLKVFMEETERITPGSLEAEKGFREAARHGKRESLGYLIERGVNVNAPDDFTGVTALMLAAGEGRGDSTEMLIEARADVNARNTKGETALMLAAANSKTNTLKELIKAGAALDLRDSGGRTALGWAIANGHGDTRKELEKAGAIQ